MHLLTHPHWSGEKNLLNPLAQKWTWAQISFGSSQAHPLSLEAGLHFEGGLRQGPEGREQLVRQKQAASYPTLTECVCLARRPNKEHIG